MNNQRLKLEEVVNINNLNHFFGEGKLKKQILFDVDLTLYAGEVIILKGPSGSGKTTLLTLILPSRHKTTENKTTANQ